MECLPTTQKCPLAHLQQVEFNTKMQTLLKEEETQWPLLW